MDITTQRARLVLLSLSGVMLIGGGLLWVGARKHRDAIALKEAVGNIEAVRSLNRKGSSASAPLARSVSGVKERALPVNEGSMRQPPKLVAQAPVPGAVLKKDEPMKPFAPAAPPLTSSGNGLEPVKPGAKMQPTSIGFTAPASQVSGISSAGGKTLPATARIQAMADARVGAGRVDPFQSITGFKPFPSGSVAPEILEPKDVPSKESFVPPPPPAAPINHDEVKEGDEGESPPSAPLDTMQNVVVVAIMDNRVVLSPTSRLQSLRRWPSSITLGAGERFDDLSVVSISSDSITLEADGARAVRTLAPVR